MKALSKLFIGGIGILVGAVAVVVLIGGQLFAVGNVGPDSTDYNPNNNPETYMEVASGGGGSLEAPTATVIIYSTVQNPRILIEGYNHCRDPSNDWGIDSTRAAVNPGGDTLFELFHGGDPNLATYAWAPFMNQVKESAGCFGETAVLTPTLVERGSPGTGTENFWTARLKASMLGSTGTNAFKVIVQDAGGNPGGYVSFTNFDGARFSLQKRPWRQEDRDNFLTHQSSFNLKFALPCNAGSTETRDLVWFDDDFGDQQGTNLWFELKERPRGTPGDNWDSVGAIYQNGTGNGDGNWGGNGPGSERSFRPTLRKDMEYNWVWHNVNDSNGVQFAIPYGSVFSKVTCIAYDLVPSLSVNNTTVEPGSVVTASSSVRNNGPTNSNPTQWQVSRFTLAPSEGVPNAGGGTSGGAPCSGFYKSPPSCTVISSGNQTFNVGDTGLPSVNNQVDDLPVGSRICYALSVQPHRHDTANWRHSAPVCVKVGKRPKVQVWGGDVISRGAIRTSTTTKNTGSGMRTFGSWGEYGIFSLSSNNAMASGSGLVGGGSPSSSQGSWSALTFANKSGVFGSYVSLPAKSAVASYFLNRASSPLPSTNLSLNGLTGILRYNGGSDVVINTSTINTGQSVVIVAPNANVRIVGNITYSSGPFANVTQIPQVVIVAANVWITGGVTNIDSWLVASGSVVTCSDVTTGAQLSSNICSNPLTVNGPVISSSLYLRRTAGSNTGAASGDPAERINLRADAYLWAKTQTNVDGNATTVFSYELPPRF